MSNSQSRRAKTAANPIPETTSLNVPFDKLRLSDKNVRTIYDQDAIKELAESIAANGLLQALSVRPLLDAEGAETGEYEVQAGGRRFRALTQLVKQKRYAADKPTPCVLKTTGHAEDDSYVENAQREALHPLDEFRAFKAMKDAGKSETDIASTHRVSVAFVRQRLRLASASPTILQAFRDEDIDLDQLMAYCITDDHARQESVYERLSESGYGSAHYIRRALTENAVTSTDRRVRFVGLDAYEKAGGVVERDLFATDSEGYLKDPELLNRLVQQKFDKKKKALLAQGWKWVEAAVEITHGDKHVCDRLIGEVSEMTAKEQKRHEMLTAELEALDALDEITDEQDTRRDELQEQIQNLEDKPLLYAQEDMATAGAFLSLDYNGNLSTQLGYIKPEDQKDHNKRGPNGARNGTNGHGESHDSNGAAIEAGEQAKPLSSSLVEDLTAFRTVALRDAVAQDFSVAFLAVVHALALSRFYSYSNQRTCLQLKMDTSFPAKAEGLDQWPATKAIADRDLAWKTLLPKSSTDLWKTLLDMDETTRQGLFAHLASLSVNAVDTHIPLRKEAVRHASQLAEALGMDMAKAGWSVTADNYLSRVSKDRILEAVTEARDEETANLIAHLKKVPMATEAERLLQGTGWLPAALRIATDDQAAAADDEDDIDDNGEGGEDALPDFMAADGTDADAAAA